MNQKINAAHWGVYKSTIENDKIVDTQPIQQEKELTNLFIQAQDEYTHSKNRVAHPYIRRSVFEHGIGAKPELRGKEDFVQVSWEQALATFHTGITDAISKYGNQSLASPPGWRATGQLNNAISLIARYFNVMGGYSKSKGDFSTGAAQIILPYIIGDMGVYTQHTAWETIHEHCQHIVLWGTDPYVTTTHAWHTPDSNSWFNFEIAKQKGIQITSINPLKPESSDRLKDNWLGIYPETDVALMMGVAHTILINNWHDLDFLTNHCDGWNIFEQYLLGETDDNIAKDSAWASEITGIEQGAIEQLAYDIANKRTMIMVGWAMQRAKHGEQTIWMATILAAMAGHIGIPGGGIGYGYHYSDRGVTVRKGIQPPGISPLTSKVNAIYPISRIADVLNNPHGNVNYNGMEITYPEIKFLVSCGGSIISRQANINEMINSLQSVDTFVKFAQFWDVDALFADIILPCTVSDERNDIAPYGSYSNKGIVPMKQMVQPYGESKDDYEIFRLLCQLAGNEEYFTENNSPMDWLEKFYNSAVDRLPVELDLPDFQTFWQNGEPITYNVEKQKEFCKFQAFREQPEQNPLKTESGKIQIYSNKIAAMNYDSCAPHPIWYDGGYHRSQQARQNNDTFQLITPHLAYRLHSQNAMNPKLRQEYEINGHEPMYMHPDDAQQLQIADHEIVHVSNEYGSTYIAVKYTNNLQKNVVAIHEGAWYDTADKNKIGQPDNPCLRGIANILTPNDSTSELTQSNAPNSATVKIRKLTVNESVPEITAFVNPV